MPPSDEDLVTRHLRGDREAFAELVARYSGRVFHLVFRFTADRLLAEDMTQESFLRAYAALPRSRAELPFRPWLYRIAVNLCRDWARRSRHQPLLFTELEADESSSMVEELPDGAPSPLDHLEAEERQEAIRSALSRLPAADRLLMTLRYDEELTYAQMGEALGLPAATVGTNLFRAKRRLQAALVDLWPGEVP